MSKWGDPNDYECLVLVDPPNDGWMKVATPEEAEKYPVNSIRYLRPISAAAFDAALRKLNRP